MQLTRLSFTLRRYTGHVKYQDGVDTTADSFQIWMRREERGLLSAFSSYGGIAFHFALPNPAGTRRHLAVQYQVPSRSGAIPTHSKSDQWFINQEFEVLKFVLLNDPQKNFKNFFHVVNNYTATEKLGRVFGSVKNMITLMPDQRDAVAPDELDTMDRSDTQSADTSGTADASDASRQSGSAEGAPQMTDSARAGR